MRKLTDGYKVVDLFNVSFPDWRSGFTRAVYEKQVEPGEYPAPLIIHDQFEDDRDLWWRQANVQLVESPNSGLTSVLVDDSLVLCIPDSTLSGPVMVSNHRKGANSAQLGMADTQQVFMPAADMGNSSVRYGFLPVIAGVTVLRLAVRLI